MKQLIFVTESENDYMYISTYVRDNFDMGNIRLDNIPMNGKCNYKNQTVINKIKKKKSGFIGESVVIYCYDTDDIDTKSSDLKFDNEITEYCTKNNYGLIWFCRDVEEVFIGEQVEQNEKTKFAIEFVRKKEISKKANLYSEIKKKHNSNLVSNINRYLVDKKDGEK